MAQRGQGRQESERMKGETDGMVRQGEVDERAGERDGKEVEGAGWMEE